MPLLISMTMPDRALEKSPIDRAITALASQVAVARPTLPDGPSLDITFMLASAADAPPFTGMRMGGYTRENGTLYFETAVPARMAQSGNAALYVATVLEDAIDNASDYFAEVCVDFDAAQWHAAVARLTDAQGHPVHAH